jgi:hypothetical protein
VSETDSGSGKHLTPQEAGEFLRSMYEHAAVGIEQVAPDGRLLMVNPALCRPRQVSTSSVRSSFGQNGLTESGPKVR